MGKKSVIFPDSEVVKVTNRYVVPLCTKVVTPQSFKLDYGKKHSRVMGIFEDCYLAPQVYVPNPLIVEQYGLKRPYAVLRFVGWFANHDVGKSGFNSQEKLTLVEELSKKIKHDVLTYADLYVGDSQTMAAEAALLGTPAVRCNSFVGPNDMSNFIMLQDQYGLLYNVAIPSDAIVLAKEISEHPLKEEWIKKREQYYNHIGDINAQIVNILEKL